MMIINAKCNKCGLALSMPEDCVDRLKKSFDDTVVTEKDGKTYIECPMPNCGEKLEISKGT